MSPIYVCGHGAVSPAGWGIEPLRRALSGKSPLGLRELERPVGGPPLKVRMVPPPQARPPFLSHPRLRRTSPITQYAVAAALEALDKEAAAVIDRTVRLGIVLCTMTGCVTYTRRFYNEILKDPRTASPLIFPETVYNAPASHLAALLGATSINYTLVGDPAAFLQGVALAADGLASDQFDGCLVIGAEELDWTSANAFAWVQRRVRLSEGAGALYLKREPVEPVIRLERITDPQIFVCASQRSPAAQQMRAELPSGSPQHLLCDGTQELPHYDAPEQEAWKNWPGARVSPKTVLGEGLMAAAAWQCVLAIDAIKQNAYPQATVSIVGCNQQAIGAHFERALH